MVKSYIATATHNIKWVQITHICLIWDQIFVQSATKTVW